MEYVRIPRNRIGVLIGKNGEIKREIEARLKVKLNIDEGGAVEIQNTGEDPLAEWKARDIVKAIARGLNPQKALKLVSDEYTLEIIELPDLVGRSEKALLRQKGRIIGSGGKTRRYIEGITGAFISVTGKDVAILGAFEEAQLAKEAVIMLATGMPHGVVYKVLEKKARGLKEKSLSLWHYSH